MSESTPKAYIIDSYSPFFKQGNEKYITEVGEHQFCIREVELNWGIPIIPERDITRDPHPESYYLYDNYDDAYAFLRKIKRINSGI